MVGFDVLGPLRVRDTDGAPIELRGALQRRLLATLLLHRGRVVSVDRLAAMVWSDDETPFSAAALQSHVFRLRQRIEGLDLVHRPSGYLLEVDGSALDAGVFERSLWEAVARRQHDPTAALRQLDDALALWRGEPFEDLVDSDDGLVETERLSELRRRASEERFGLMLDLGRSADTIADLEAFAAREPLRERPRALLIDAFAREGRRAEALRVYDSYRRLLGEEMGVSPSADLRARHERLLAEDDDPVVEPNPPSVPSRARSPLRRRSSSFIGREAVLTQIEQFVQESRLVTLLGPGGVGKTSLAVEAARRMEPAFAGGVVFCDLTPAGPSGAVTVVAAAVGVENRTGHDEVERITDVLRNERCLLVFDNCEHVIDEVAAIAEEVLEQTEHVIVIATSRIRLAVPGEKLCVVSPLECDGDASPAMLLFAERARAVAPGFAIDETNRATVRELCACVDGLPLAIELAAARLQSMSLAEIRDGLDHSLAILHGGRRTVERHRSVEAAIDWSYGQLDAVDRQTLVAASTYASAFDADDVAAILDVSGSEATERMATLVECSLAHRVGSDFALLDVVRRYASEHPDGRATSGERTTRHAARMLVRAEAISALLRTALDSVPIDELSRRFIDFRHATDAAVEAGDADTALRIVCALRDIGMNAMSPESMRWGDRVAELGDTVDHPLAADGYAVAAMAAWKRSDFGEMRRLLVRAEATAQRIGVGDRFEVVGTLGVEDLALGRLESAVERFRRTLVMEEVVGDPLRNAESGATLAICLAYAHDGEAAAVSDRLISEVVPTGGAVAGSWCWYAAGECRLDDDPGAAREYLDRAVHAARLGGSVFVEGVAGASLASLDVRAGDFGAAIRTYRWLLPLWLRSGVRSPFWTAMRSVVKLCASIGADESATRLLGAVFSPALGHDVYGDDDVRLAQLARELSGRMGAERFDAVLASGAQLDDAAAALEATAAFDGFG
jgi:predicted ATPase/DNA-binding SARP family transcriptional activator